MMNHTQKIISFLSSIGNTRYLKDVVEQAKTNCDQIQFIMALHEQTKAKVRALTRSQYSERLEIKKYRPSTDLSNHYLTVAL
ncbi:MAG: hypothetical protein GY696_27760 [Gammaproteobacteria bacterium]|nr:hypothetical protein [Gammaproteobacteria bacterium]